MGQVFWHHIKLRGQLESYVHVVEMHRQIFERNDVLE